MLTTILAAAATTAAPQNKFGFAEALEQGGFIAYATVAVLGSNPGEAPLSDLLVLGFGEWARPVTAVVAVLLSVGAINAYFAGGARLGAALARDGSLPTWLARGSTAGEVPRRSLVVVALGGLTSLGVITIWPPKNHWVL